MCLGVVDGSTVQEFIDDAETFKNSINQRFEIIDVDGDGQLSPDDLRHGLDTLLSLGHGMMPKEMDNLYDTLFVKFDKDQNGKIDREEFLDLIKEIMVALARGLGNSPVLVALEKDSLLAEAIEHQLAHSKGDDYNECCSLENESCHEISSGDMGIGDPSKAVVNMMCCLFLLVIIYSPLLM